MLAVKGIYNDGQIILKGKLPVKSAEVIVVFPDNDEIDGQIDLSVDKKRKLFEEFSGSVARTIDVRAEKMEELDRKYESVD